MTSPVVELPSGAVVTLAPPAVPAVQAAPPTAPQLVLLPSPGPRGQTGLPGEGVQIFGEVLTGIKDGVNTVFTTAAPYVTASTAVYRNGLREQRGTGYTESGAGEITFGEAPLSTDDLTIDYILG